MASCPFCQIVDGDRDAHRVYEDETTLAFLDARPAAPGHTLVLPRAHRESLFAAPEATTTAVFRATRTVARAIERALSPAAFSVFHTTGDFVGTVSHAHVHLVPRYADDDVHVALAREDLEAEDGGRIAAEIRERR